MINNNNNVLSDGKGADLLMAIIGGEKVDVKFEIAKSTKIEVITEYRRACDENLTKLELHRIERILSLDNPKAPFEIESAMHAIDRIINRYMFEELMIEDRAKAISLAHANSKVSDEVGTVYSRDMVISSKTIEESRASHKKASKTKTVSYRDDIRSNLKKGFLSYYKPSEILENGTEIILRLKDADYIVRCTTKKTPLTSFEKATTPAKITARDGIMKQIGTVLLKTDKAINIKTHGWLVINNGNHFTVKVTKKTARVEIEA